jgi:hypothetical protein
MAQTLVCVIASERRFETVCDHVQMVSGVENITMECVNLTPSGI